MIKAQHKLPILRIQAAALALLLLFLLCGEGRASPRSVVYTVKARTETWIPIRLPDIEHALASTVAAALARGDLMTLSPARLDPRTRKPALGSADMLLEIHGDVVEQAGNFSVNLVLKPVRDPGLPSFVTAATVSISGKPKQAMYKLMLASSRRAADRLYSAMRSRLGRSAKSSGDTLPADLFEWAKLAAPRPRPSSQDLKTFLNSSLSWDRRKEAGFRLAGLAFDDANVRHALQQVALTDPDKIARYYAVRFLAPSSRVHLFTQRVLLGVAREDSDPRTKGEALRLSEHFFGLSPLQTRQTWVQLLTARLSELSNSDFSRLVKHLGFRLDSPNLDLGLLGCLTQQEVQEEGRRRKDSCLSLARLLPAQRRTAMLLAYLDRPLTRFTNDLPDRYKGGPLGTAIRLAFEDPCRVDALARVCSRLLRESKDLRTSALLVQALAEKRLTPDVLRRAGRLAVETTDNRLRSKLIRLLENPSRNHKPPWDVLVWSTAKKVYRDLLAGGGLESYGRRTLERALEKLGKLQGEAHKAGLRRHLSRSGAPTSGATAHFTDCVLSSSEQKTQRDCAAGLRWLALDFPRHRSRAEAAMRRLLSQTDKELHTWTRRALESSLRTLERQKSKNNTGRKKVRSCPAR